LGFSKRHSEYLTQADFIAIFFLMSFVSHLIDTYGRRTLMVNSSIVLTASFSFLALFGGLAPPANDLQAQEVAPSLLGSVSLFVATGAFGIGWLPTAWLVPEEIHSPGAQAQAAVISVIVWGLSNFGITLLSPLLFNNVSHWIFLVFAVSNALTGLWTQQYLPESNGRTTEEVQNFFKDSKDQGTWRVGLVADGLYKRVPRAEAGEDAERAPLLRTNDV
jgi:MFS family permease